MKSAANKSDLNKLHRNYEICSPPILVYSLHTVHTVNIFAEFITDWEIGNSSGQWLDKTSTYQMREQSTVPTVSRST